MLSRIGGSSRKGKRREQQQQEQEEIQEQQQQQEVASETSSCFEKSVPLNDQLQQQSPQRPYYYTPSSEQEQQHGSRKQPLIYSAPTVDSLGDESTLYGRPHLATPRLNSPNGNGDKQGRHHQEPQSMKSIIREKSADERSKQRDQVFRHVTTNNNKNTIRPTKKSNAQNNNEFQIEEDAISVNVRTIPVAERSAFALRPITMPATNSAGFHNYGNKKISPSWQHYHIIQKLQSITHIRQLGFMPLDSSNINVRKRKDDNNRHTYHSIDPVQATISSLPATPPLLSNKKHRLPRRSDVGFPNASLDEIQLKQTEIQQETEWEEASPRLIVLVTSDDLGTAVQDEKSSSTSSSLPSSSILPGIPWAGRELIQAKERNSSHNTTIIPNQRKDQSTMTTTTKDTPTGTRLVPDPTNMLAPPLDSTSSSSSLGWRPRPFHDRPPGMKYTLVCPLDINFTEVGGAIEPLVCSLTLFSLKKKTSKSSNSASTIVDGKTSEEFWFPAGEWSSSRNGDTHKDDVNNIDDSINAATTRKLKAIFAHDPLLLDENNYQDLFVVLQVYKVTHQDLAAAYIADKNNASNKGDLTTTTDRKKLHQRLKKLKQFKAANKDNDKNEMEEDASLLASYRASAVYENFGTKFLSPLCFGINPLFSAGQQTPEVLWPNGDIQQNMQLYSFPSHSESHEDFTERLRTIAFQQHNAAPKPNVSLFAVDEAVPLATVREDRSTVSSAVSTTTSSQTAESASAATFSSPNKKKSGVRRFMRQLNAKRTDQQASSSSSASVSSAITSDTAPNTTSVTNIQMIEPTQMIPVTVTLFVSALDVDFLQSMLTTPLELAEKRKEDQEKPTPNLLVDASGEAAIMVDPNKEGQKRSSLVRLPPRPGGYTGASDFREVLFLPPRPRKSYDVDTTPSYRSLLNLLYLYPRLIVSKQPESSSPSSSTKKKNNKQQQLYTIRMRLIQNMTETVTDDDVVKTSSKVVEAFHNPTPWAGPALLKSVYTRIPVDGLNDVRSAIHLKDEFKLKLPMILDGSHYLHFSLFALDFKDDFLGDSTTSGVEPTNEHLSLQPISDIMIPLSSPLKDPTSGAKATTIIPNGWHRLKLGGFQFQIETRLVSSIHVSDPTVASALRDFPLNDESSYHFEGNQITEHALVPSRTLSRQASSDSEVHENSTYSTLFSMASGSALVSHFRPLLVMHLSNLINTGKGVDANERFLVGNLRSFLEVCRQVKSNILGSCAQGEKRWRVFVKSIIDSFDEGNLRSISLPSDPEEDASSEVFTSRPQEHSNSADEEGEEDFDGGAIRRRKKDSIRSGIDLRISKTYSAMESSETACTPFSRVAYGATKTDRMRLEAELDNDTSRFTHLVDDDETVATFATGMTSGEARMAEARDIFDKNKLISSKSFTADAIETSFMSVSVSKDDNTPSVGSSNNMDFSSYQRTISEIGLGLPKRVRSAAQTMLAPCVGPNISAVFSSSPRNSKTSARTSSKKRTNSISRAEKDTPKKTGQSQQMKLFSPGSDVEDSEGNKTEEFDALSHMGALHQTSNGVFRAPWNCPTLVFSIEDGSKVYGFSLGRGDYLYETIMVVWLHSWMDHIAQKETGKSRDMRRTRQTAIPSFGDDMQNDPFSAFHCQLDVLLPICLKSLVVRYGEVVRSPHLPTARVVADLGHLAVLQPFVEMLSLSLMGQAMKGLVTGDKDGSLIEALEEAERVLDFLAGLCTVFHPAHMSMLIQKLFLTLRNCEANPMPSGDEESTFEWTDETLHRVKCSRQLRLRAAEKLAALPNFIALNFPSRFQQAGIAGRPKKPTWTMQYSENSKTQSADQEEPPYGHDGLLPRSAWLAELLSTECLSICALSCEAVVAEAMAHIETHQDAIKVSDEKALLNQRPTASLKRDDLLMFQSIAIHSITCVHELLLRRHAMDRRFQKESSRGRIASLFAKPIFEKSLSSVRWLARMESTHKVRSLWLLCFVYILQEAPESLLREAVRSYSDPEDGRIHRFIRLLRLGSSTFQSFIDQQRHCMFPSEIDIGLSPWLLQESFNTICATIIVVVEECASPTSTCPREQQKMIQGILDLLLHVLTMPQSSVTHLRAVGGAIQALENFGPAMFLDIAGGTIQHWIRVILSLMNSIALSVRSVAVDFVISLLGSVFDMLGNIDELAMIFTSVLPEVVAREAALCSVNGFISNLSDVEKSVWPLRRALAEIEDANPLDDDRIDPQLSPVLSVFCRACQAIIDGVLIEMRLQGDRCVVVGSRMPREPEGKYTFDADEESLFEAANFFGPETAPMQRIRWLMTLKSLHEAKGQWIEAAESLMMCARTISDSIPHLRNMWRPSRFALWSDARRSLWLSTVGEEMGNPELGNDQVVSFADAFLEPPLLGATIESATNYSKLSQPTVSRMCILLMNIVREAVAMYGREEGLDGLAYSRLESLLKILMGILDQHGASSDLDRNKKRFAGSSERKRYVEEETCLRRVLAGISGDMTKLAERMLLLAKEVPSTPEASGETLNQKSESIPYYVRVVLSGKKTPRFLESTTLPTFLEWGSPCICRVPKSIVASLASKGFSQRDQLEEMMCSAFGKPLVDSLQRYGGEHIPITFRTGSHATRENGETIENEMYLDISLVQMSASGQEDQNFSFESNHFVYRKALQESNHVVHGLPDSAGATFVEMTVANPFPCPLSRQRTLLISEFTSSG